MSKQRARPVYTPELAHEICRRLTEGETLRVICQGEEMPAASTVRLWVLDDLNGFAEQYARARLVGYHTMADELIEIADDGTNDYVEKERPDGSKAIAFDAEHVQRSRLRVDTRKWLLSKALPRIYGDKVTAEVSGPDGGPIKTEEKAPLELARGIAFILSTAQRTEGA